MKLFIILTILLTFCFLSSNSFSQYSRVVYYTGSACSSSDTPILDVYTSGSTCVNTSCTAYSLLSTWYGYSICASSVPSGSKNTLQYNVYSDTTCTSSKLTVSTIFPIDTCIYIAGVGSYKSNGCTSMTIYSDTACKTVFSTTNYSSYSGVCYYGTKYICNDGGRTRLSVIILTVVYLLLSFIF